MTSYLLTDHSVKESIASFPRDADDVGETCA